MRSAFLAVLALSLGCAPGVPDQQMTPRETASIRAEIERAMRDAYDLSRPNVSERMLSLYPDSGTIVSVAGGRVVASRDSLEAGIRYFWDNVGRNMRQPKWVWERFFVDVLSPTAAVATATYRIPHRNPQNEPHELGGAMTFVFEKRGGRWVILQEHLSDLPQSPTPDSLTTGMPTHEH